MSSLRRMRLGKEKSIRELVIWKKNQPSGMVCGRYTEKKYVGNKYYDYFREIKKVIFIHKKRCQTLAKQSKKGERGE